MCDAIGAVGDAEVDGGELDGVDELDGIDGSDGLDGPGELDE